MYIHHGARFSDSSSKSALILSWMGSTNIYPSSREADRPVCRAFSQPLLSFWPGPNLLLLNELLKETDYWVGSAREKWPRFAQRNNDRPELILSRPAATVCRCTFFFCLLPIKNISILIIGPRQGQGFFFRGDQFYARSRLPHVYFYLRAKREKHI